MARYLYSVKSIDTPAIGSFISASLAKVTPDPPIALTPPFITFVNVSMPVNILIYSVTVNQNFSPPKDLAYLIIFENVVGPSF